MPIIEIDVWKERVHEAQKQREHVTPEQRALVEQIKRTWGDTKDKNFAVARMLRDMFPSYPAKTRWNQYGLPFGYSWARRLLKIADDSRIEQHFEIMPESRSALHEVSKLNDADFKEAIQPSPTLGYGIVNPGATAEDIREWLRFKRGAPMEAYANITVQFRPGMESARDLLDALVARIKSGGKQVLIRKIKTTNVPPQG